jgi:hypothetical protein
VSLSAQLLSVPETKTPVKCGIETYNLLKSALLSGDFRKFDTRVGKGNLARPYPQCGLNIVIVSPFRFTPRLSVALGGAKPYWSIGQIVSRTRTCTCARRRAPQVVYLRREFEEGSLRFDSSIDFISRITVRENADARATWGAASSALPCLTHRSVAGEQAGQTLDTGSWFRGSCTIGSLVANSCDSGIPMQHLTSIAGLVTSAESPATKMHAAGR